MEVLIVFNNYFSKTKTHMFTFLAFVSYIMNETNITYPEAKIEATQRCQNLFYTPYARDERVESICSDVWKESFPNAYILK